MSKFVLTAQLQLRAPNNVRQVVNQIQKQLNNVVVNVQLQNATQTQSQLNGLSKSADNAGKSFDKMGNKFSAAVRRFSALAIATRAVSLFTNTLGSAIRESIDFERELVKVSQVTGQTVTQLGFLSKAITELSTSLGVGSTSLLNVSRILSQAGLSAKETEIALATLARTELAPTFDNITQTAEGAVAIFNQFGKGAEALESQLGSINAVAGKFAVEAGDLISTIRRAGGVFKASGGDLNELVALFTSVRATTRESAESIATGLRTIFTRIQRPKTIEFLKQYGVELTDLEGKFVGPYEAVRRLSRAFAGLERGDLTFVKIAEELGGFRQIGKVIPLLQQFRVAQDALNVAQGGSSSLAQDAASAQAALAVKITRVKEEFLALVRSVTETTTFKIMANTALTLASSFVKVADSLKTLIPLITAFAAIKLTRGLGGFLGNVAGSKGFNQGGKVHAFASGGIVPGSGNSDTVPAMLTPGEFVIRKSSVQKLGAENLATMNRGGEVQKFKKGGTAIKRGQQVGGVGIYDSDMVGAGGKVLLGQITASGKPYEVIHGPAGSGKTTFAAKRFGSNFIKSAEDIDKYGRFVVISGAGEVKGGGLSPQASAIMSGATKITALAPSPDTVMSRRESRLANGAMDNRSEGQLRGTLKAPTTFNKDLYKQFRNVELLEKFANGGKVDIKVEDGAIGGFFLTPDEGTDRNFDLSKGKAVGKMITNPNVIASIDDRGVPSDDELLKSLSVSAKERLFGKVSAKTGKKAIQDPSFNSKTKVTLSQELGGGKVTFESLGAEGKRKLQEEVNKSTSTGAGYEVASLKGQGVGFLPGKDIEQNKDIANAVSVATQNILKQGVTEGAQKILSLGNFGGVIKLDKDGLSGADRLANDSNARASVEGFLFEGIIDAITGANLAGGKQAFDFPFSSINAHREDLQRFFTPTDSIDNLKNADAKRSYSLKDTIAKKVVGDINAGNTLGYEITKRQDVKKKNFATGGPVGTDTVPALLTPGEFVVNKASAQRIGYGNLHTMNKVGKFAKGGTVGFGQGPAPQKFSFGAMVDPDAYRRPTSQLPPADPSKAQSGLDSFSTGLILASGVLTSFSPTVDESSGSLRRLTAGTIDTVASLAGLVGTVQAVGINTSSLSKGLTSLGQRNIPFVSNKLKGLGEDGIQKFAKGLQAGALAVAATTVVMNKYYQAIEENARRQKESALQAGDLAGAQEAAMREAAYDIRGSFANVGAVIGGAIGTIGGIIAGGASGFGIGAVPGAGIGGISGAIVGGGTGEVLADLFGYTEEAYKAARAEITLTYSRMAVAKSLQEAESKTANAMKQLEAGSITASQALQQIGADAAFQKLTEEQQATRDVNKSSISDINNQLQNTSFLGSLLSFGPGGFGGFGGSAEVDKVYNDAANRTSELNQEIAKVTAAFAPFTNALLRSAAASGQSFDQFFEGLKTSNSGLYEFYSANASAKAELVTAFSNISVEIQKTEAYLRSLNLGLSTVAGAAAALNAKLESMDEMQSGISPSATLNTLRTSQTSGAVGISFGEFNTGLDRASDTLVSFGASNAEVNKFRQGMKATYSVQKNANSVLETYQRKLQADNKAGRRTDISPEKMVEGFVNDLVKSSRLTGADAQRFKDSIRIEKIDLKEVELGNFQSVIDEVGVAGESYVQQIESIMQAQAAYESKLISAQNKVSEAFNNLTNAMRQNIDLQIESAKTISKYGGKRFSPQDEYRLTSRRLDTSLNRSGIGITGGDPAQITRAFKEIGQEIKRIKMDRSGMSQSQSAQADTRLKELQEANQTLVNDTRKLIGVKQEELRIIEAKNAAEKTALDKLLSGDEEGFIEGMQTVQAANLLQSGRPTTGIPPEILYRGFKDLERRFEAGDPTVTREMIQGSAQAVAMSLGYSQQASQEIGRRYTGGDEARRVESDIQDLARTLPEAGSNMITAATKIYDAAVKFEQAVAESKPAVVAETKSMGGIIYANTGKYVKYEPKGTDTVPAMLTPGEFVVNARATKQHRSLLENINSGKDPQYASRGGIIGPQYLATGGKADEEEIKLPSEDEMFKRWMNSKEYNKYPLGSAGYTSEYENFKQNIIDEHRSKRLAREAQEAKAKRDEEIRKEEAQAKAERNAYLADKNAKSDARMKPYEDARKRVDEQLKADRAAEQAAREKEIAEKEKVREERLAEELKEQIYRQSPAGQAEAARKKEQEKARIIEQLNAEIAVQMAEQRRLDVLARQAGERGRTAFQLKYDYIPLLGMHKSDIYAGIDGFFSGLSPENNVVTRTGANALGAVGGFGQGVFGGVQALAGVAGEILGQGVAGAGSLMGGSTNGPESWSGFASNIGNNLVQGSRNVVQEGLGNISGAGETIGRNTVDAALGTNIYSGENTKIGGVQLGNRLAEQRNAERLATADEYNVGNITRGIDFGARTISEFVTPSMALPKQTGLLNKPVTEVPGAIKSGTKKFLDRLDAPSNAAAAAKNKEISRLHKAAKESGISAEEVNYAIADAEAMGRRAGSPLDKMIKKIEGQQSTKASVAADTITDDNIALILSHKKDISNLSDKARKKALRRQRRLDSRERRKGRTDLNNSPPQITAQERMAGGGQRGGMFDKTATPYAGDNPLSDYMPTSSSGPLSRESLQGTISTIKEVKAAEEAAKVAEAAAKQAQKAKKAPITERSEILKAGRATKEFALDRIPVYGKGRVAKREAAEAAEAAAEASARAKKFGDTMAGKSSIASTVNKAEEIAETSKAATAAKKTAKTVKAKKPFTRGDQNLAMHNIDNMSPAELRTELKKLNEIIKNNTRPDGSISEFGKFQINGVDADIPTLGLRRMALSEKLKTATTSTTGDPKLVAAVKDRTKHLGKTAGKYASSPAAKKRLKQEASELFGGVDDVTNSGKTQFGSSSNRASVSVNNQTGKTQLRIAGKIDNTQTLDHELGHQFQNATVGLTKKAGEELPYAVKLKESLGDDFTNFLKKDGAYDSLRRSLGKDFGGGMYSSKDILDKPVELFTSLLEAASNRSKIFNQNKEAVDMMQKLMKFHGYANGGIVYASSGGSIFKPRGTDTIPAMLSPGEFVVNASAVKRGNNLQMLQAMNKNTGPQNAQNFAKGGVVRYRQNGSTGPESASGSTASLSVPTIDPSVVDKFAGAIDKFNSSLLSSIDKLQNTSIKIKMEPTNINLNLTGTEALKSITTSVKQELMTFISDKMSRLKLDNAGNIVAGGGSVD